jgi:ABC-type amino acid transport substrate-binding protein
VIAPASPFAATSYAYAVRKGDAAWLERMNAFVRSMKRDGRLAEAARRHDLLPIVVTD